MNLKLEKGVSSVNTDDHYPGHCDKTECNSDTLIYLRASDMLNYTKENIYQEIVPVVS